MSSVRSTAARGYILHAADVAGQRALEVHAPGPGRLAQVAPAYALQLLRGAQQLVHALAAAVQRVGENHQRILIIAYEYRVGKG